MRGQRITLIIIATAYVVNFIYLGVDLPTFHWPDSKEYLLFRNCMQQGSCTWVNLFINRPFTLPMLYYLAGTDDAIYLIQEIAFMLSFLILGYQVSTLFNSKWQGITSFVFILLVSCSTNFYFWHHALLTECATIIFFNLLLIFLIIIYKKGQKQLSRHIIIYSYLSIIILLLFSHLRDSHVYITLFYLIALFTITGRKISKPYIHLSLMVILVGANYIFQQRLMVNNGRYKAPLLNVISMRMLPQPAYSHWFFQHGLPNDSCTLSCTGLYAYAYVDKWECFGTFQTSEGVAAYKKFLLLHPAYSFYPLIKHRDYLLNKDLSFYAHAKKVPTFSTVAANLTGHSFWALIGSIILLLVAAVLKRIKEFRKAVNIFIIAFITLVVMAFVNFHGDAFEIGRHCMLVQYFNHFFSLFFFFVGLQLIKPGKGKSK